MPGYLGCPETRIEVRRLDRYSAPGVPISPPVLTGYHGLSGWESATYTRTFNTWGPFRIVLGGGALCQNLLSQMEPSWWEVRFMRGTEIAYSGIIHEITQTVGGEGAVIAGGDMASVFHEDGGRLINLHNMQYEDVDPVDIAADVIRRAFALTEPVDAYLMDDYLYTNPVGETIDYAPGVTAEYVGDTLDDLTSYGLMYAAVGRRLILSSVADLSRRSVATLTTAHFSGDVRITTSSLDMGVQGVAVGEDDNGDPLVTVYGEAGSPWGSPSIRVDVDKGVSARSRLTAARRAIQGRTRPSTRIDMPSAARLMPTAPIPFRNLRPGSARVDVEVSHATNRFRQPTMLTEVEVSIVPGREEVQATFAPIGAPVDIG